MRKKYISIELNNCGNIISGNIKIEKKKLNVFYGINGTGKTTIVKSIKKNLEKSLDELQTFYNNDKPSIKISEDLQTICFDEEFVSNFVFKETGIIDKPFEVFFKTPKYEIIKKILVIF